MQVQWCAHFRISLSVIVFDFTFGLCILAIWNLLICALWLYQLSPGDWWRCWFLCWRFCVLSPIEMHNLFIWIVLRKKFIDRKLLPSKWLGNFRSQLHIRIHIACVWLGREMCWRCSEQFFNIRIPGASICLENTEDKVERDWNEVLGELRGWIC